MGHGEEVEDGVGGASSAMTMTIASVPRVMTRRLEVNLEEVLDRLTGHEALVHLEGSSAGMEEE